MPRLALPFPQCYLRQFIIAYLPPSPEEHDGQASRWSGVVHEDNIVPSSSTLHVGPHHRLVREENVFDSDLAFDLEMKKRTLQVQERVFAGMKERLAEKEAAMAETRAEIDALTIAIAANAG